MLTSAQITSFVLHGFVVIPGAMNVSCTERLAALALRRVATHEVSIGDGIAVDRVLEDDWDAVIRESVESIAPIAGQLLQTQEVYAFELLTRWKHARSTAQHPRIDGVDSYIEGEHSLDGIPPYLLLVGVALHPLVDRSEGPVLATRGGHRVTQYHFESNPLPSESGRPLRRSEVQRMFQPVLEGALEPVPLHTGDAFIASSLVPYALGENSTAEDRSIAWIRFGFAEPGLTTRGVSRTDYPGIDVL